MFVHLHNYMCASYSMGVACALCVLATWWVWPVTLVFVDVLVLATWWVWFEAWPVSILVCAG